MYSWSKGLPHETKILEAYKMLKQQGIVKDDPDYIDKVIWWMWYSFLRVNDCFFQMKFGLFYDLLTRWATRFEH